MAEAPKRIEIPLTVEHDGETVEIKRLCYVREDVAERENAELREEVEQWHKLTANIELPEYPMCEFQPKDLERENAELRELVRDALTTISWCTIDCYPSDNKKRELNERARELGVEVEG